MIRPVIGPSLLTVWTLLMNRGFLGLYFSFQMGSYSKRCVQDIQTHLELGPPAASSKPTCPTYLVPRCTKQVRMYLCDPNLVLTYYHSKEINSSILPVNSAYSLEGKMIDSLVLRVFHRGTLIWRYGTELEEAVLVHL